MSAALGAVFFAVAVAGAAYLAIAAAALAAFARRPLELATDFLPSVSVLKPIAGSEPDLENNLASVCDQDYGAPYDVVFCLHSHDDPALPTVERVAAQYAACASIAVGESDGMLNPKIANLAKPGVEMRGELVVIADSDIRVDRNYLRALAEPFASQRVGAVTCLYAGMPTGGVVSRLGALQIEDGFAPSVLVALALGKLRFCLGATMAVRGRVLEEIGGLAALGRHLADDYRLGERVAAAGYDVRLLRYVVKTSVAEQRIGDLWRHEIRWARTNRALAPAGYAFSFLTYALPFALLSLAFARNTAWSAALLALVAGLRLAVHYLARGALEVARPDDVWLIPVRDCLSLAVWAASLFGGAMRWRDKLFFASSA